jgi:adenylate kinase
VIRQRMATYKQQTMPLSEYYRKGKLLHVVDAMGTMDDVFSRVRTVTDQMKSLRR